MFSSSASVKESDSVTSASASDSPIRPRNWKKIALFSLLGLVSITVGIGVYRYLKPPQARIAISKETTYITEPLNPLGLPDYAAYLNARLSEGVTPETNAAVKLWEALGPLPDFSTPKFHQAMARELGMSPLPVHGNYFTDLNKWLKEQHLPPDELNQQRENLSEEFEVSRSIPWQSSEYPQLVAWFERNEIPLKRVHEAVQRPHYYRPVIVEPGPLNSSGRLISALLPDVQNFSEIAKLLCSRAMWHLGEGRIEEAQQDLLDCHRLARLIARNWAAIEISSAMRMDQMASSGAAALAVDPQLTAEQARFYRQELEKLGPLLTLVEIAEIINQGERFAALDTVIGVATTQTVWEDLGIGGRGNTQIILDNAQRIGVNWNATLHEINTRYDELVAGLLLPDRVDQERALRDLCYQIQDEHARLSDWRNGTYLILGGGTARGRAVACIVNDLFLSNCEFFLTWSSSVVTQWQVTQIGFALAEYRRIQGRYPQRLEDLQPEFLAEIPEDVFSGKPLVYQVSEDGLEMKLYSVGRNGIDNGGIGAGWNRRPYLEQDDIGVLDPIPAIPEDAAESTEVVSPFE